MNKAVFVVDTQQGTKLLLFSATRHGQKCDKEEDPPVSKQKPTCQSPIVYLKRFRNVDLLLDKGLFWSFFGVFSIGPYHNGSIKLRPWALLIWNKDYIWSIG